MAIGDEKPEKGKGDEAEQQKKPAPVKKPEQQEAPAEEEERKKIEGAVAKVLTGNKEAVAKGPGKGKKEEKLPENKFSKTHREVEKLLQEHPEHQGPIANGVLAVLAFLAKYGGIFENFSASGFFDSLTEEGSDFKEEAFEKEDLQKLQAGPLNEPDTTDFDKLSDEEASTNYTSLLLGIEPLDEARVLAARLLYTEKDGHKCYKGYKPKSLKRFKREYKEKVPRGTVVFFIKDMLGGVLSAVATGDGDKFVYYDPKTKETKSFSLSASESPVSEGEFRAAFVPRAAPAA